MDDELDDQGGPDEAADDEVSPGVLREMKRRVMRDMAEAERARAQDLAEALGPADPVALLVALRAERASRLVLAEDLRVTQEALQAVLDAMKAGIARSAEDDDPYGLGIPQSFDVGLADD